MRIWLACFGLLFVIAELYQWVKHLTLPLPFYVLGGAFLAIASNHNKLASWFSREPIASSEPATGSATPIANSAPQQLPPKSISFIISRSNEAQG